MSVKCGGAPVVLAELEALAADVELKHLLWTVQQEWATATSKWSTEQFLELDVLEMQDQVGCYWATYFDLLFGIYDYPLSDVSGVTT